METLPYLRMQLSGAHEAMRRNYRSNSEDDTRYAELSHEHIRRSVQEGMIADGISLYLRLSDIDGALALARQADRQEIIRGFSNTAHLAGGSAARLHAILDVLDARGLTANEVPTGFGLCGAAIQEDDAGLFDRGVAWGEIQVRDIADRNHEIIGAINKTGPRCRPRLAALLRQGVRDPDKAQALRKTASLYQMPQAKVLLTLAALGVSLSEDECALVAAAIAHAEISNHARLLLEGGTMTVEQMLALSVTLN